jgi:hypothetical protein
MHEIDLAEHHDPPQFCYDSIVHARFHAKQVLHDGCNKHLESWGHQESDSPVAIEEEEDQ